MCLKAVQAHSDPITCKDVVAAPPPSRAPVSLRCTLAFAPTHPFAHAQPTLHTMSSRSAVDFSRDGTLLVSSSYDGLWSGLAALLCGSLPRPPGGLRVPDRVRIWTRAAPACNPPAVEFGTRRRCSA